MTIVERERLQFYTDLHDPTSVYHFPEDFVTFLKNHERDWDAEQFLSMVRAYMGNTPPEDLDMQTICAIAAMYADIYDVSGVPFEENPFLSGEDSQETESRPESKAEEVLEELDEDVPRPTDVQPEFPDIVLEIADGNTLEQLVYHSIAALGQAGYSKAADNLAKNILGALQVEPTPLAILRIIRSYVDVQFDVGDD